MGLRIQNLLTSRNICLQRTKDMIALSHVNLDRQFDDQIPTDHKQCKIIPSTSEDHFVSPHGLNYLVIDTQVKKIPGPSTNTSKGVGVNVDTAVGRISFLFSLVTKQGAQSASAKDQARKKKRKKVLPTLQYANILISCLHHRCVDSRAQRFSRIFPGKVVHIDSKVRLYYSILRNCENTKLFLRSCKAI